MEWRWRYRWSSSSLPLLCGRAALRWFRLAAQRQHAGAQNMLALRAVYLSDNGDDTSPTNEQYKFDLSESNVVKVDKYRLKIIMAYEADMMFRFVVN